MLKEYLYISYQLYIFIISTKCLEIVGGLRYYNKCVGTIM